MPNVGELSGPRPRASRPIDARMAPATAVTKLAATYGIRLGIISLTMISGPLMPETRANSTYPRSRITST